MNCFYSFSGWRPIFSSVVGLNFALYRLCRSSHFVFDKQSFVERDVSHSFFIYGLQLARTYNSVVLLMNLKSNYKTCWNQKLSKHLQFNIFFYLLTFSRKMNINLKYISDNILSICTSYDHIIQVIVCKKLFKNIKFLR